MNFFLYCPLPYILNHTKSRPSNYMTAREAFCEKISSIFCWTFFCPDSFLKAFIIWNWRWFQFLVNFFLVFFFLSLLPRPYSLPSGSSAQTLRRGRQPELWRVGRVGRVGRWAKRFFNFFYFEIYIKSYTHIYIRIYIYKNCPDKFLVGL